MLKLVEEIVDGSKQFEDLDGQGLDQLIQSQGQVN